MTNYVGPVAVSFPRIFKFLETWVKITGNWVCPSQPHCSVPVPVGGMYPKLPYLELVTS